MRDFKRILLSLGAVLIAFAVVSLAVIEPCLNNSREAYYCDSEVRGELAGTLDCLIIGSSEGLVAFDPAVIDEELSVHSYNLCGTLMTLGSTYYFLEKELERNPVKTVVLEFSPSTLREREASYESGDIVTLRRLDSFGERWGFMLKHMDLEEWPYAYSVFFLNGLKYTKDSLLGHEIPDFLNDPTGEQVTKGAYFKPAMDITLSKEEAEKVYATKAMSVDYPAECIKEYEGIIDLCKSHGVKVAAVYVPVADSYNWKYANQDEFEAFAEAFFDRLGCDYYNMNLYKGRFELWNDRVSFNGEQHMSREGATSFSKAFSDVWKADASEKDTYFFDDYSQMLQYSPYRQ